MRPEVPSNPGAFEELSKAREVCLFEKALGCGARGGRGTWAGKLGAQALSSPTLRSLFRSLLFILCFFTA